MSIIVTGATGFLGSALIDRLVSEGYGVIGIARKSGGFLTQRTREHPNFSFIACDLANEHELPEREAVDVIFHLAAQISSSRKNDFMGFLRNNVQATYTMLQLARRVSCQRFVYTSTGSIFSTLPPEGVVSERTCPSPCSYYGLTKYIGERLVAMELDGSDVQGIVVRFPSIFGKNQSIGIVPTFYTLARQHLPIELYSEGERYRNLLYLDDAVEILVRCISYQQEMPFEIIGAGSPDSQKMITIAAKIRDLLGSQSEILPIEKTLPSDIDSFIDISKLQNALGFTPRTIEAGIKAWLQELSHAI